MRDRGDALFFYMAHRAAHRSASSEPAALRAVLAEVDPRSVFSVIAASGV
jgi:hypothetical protein